MLTHVRYAVFAVTILTMAPCAVGWAETNGRYPDYGFAPDVSNRQLFQLSQDYPVELPPASDMPAFMNNDMPEAQWREYYKQNWKEYLLQVRKYCFEGNIEVDWRVQENTVRKWYHMPWLHWGRFGREGLRGLTKEAPIQPRQIAEQQSSGGQAYAIAFYNAHAGYLLEKVWRNPDAPDVEAVVRENGFPQGSVIFKILFADNSPRQVPWLVNPITWEAYICQSFGSDDRSIRDVHLVQMDIMIKDERAETGWLYGTYQYNGALNRPNPWENLVPVGLQWGNDPGVTADDFTNPQPKKTRINPAIKESVINSDANELPATHLGWNGRLNGPLDNPRSSCMSCHMVAQYPYDGDRISPLFIAGANIAVGSEEWMKWFANLHCMTTFDTGTVTNDSSLQLSMGLRNFYDWRDNRGGKKAPK